MKQVSQLINQLEDALKAAELWQSQPIEAAKLQSTQPFAIDTMSFEQWLQFIFIARMRALIDAGQPLPTAMGIAPMAEQVYLDKPEAQTVVNCCFALDEAING
ncbi:YqcC family protein [Paraferrimonas sp. SM1919]|uniref:YqcC family protein n=1 Tax=Paraferrimonas sp. SM1919 TaxID=2662263 RepID=UPI0013D5623E|nr:YqcC family protein [Paraferrimonas sp. SM1919]